MSMNRVLLLLFPAFFFALSPLFGMDDTANAGITKHYDESIFKKTEKGFFGVEVMINQKDLKMGVNTIDVIVHDKNDRDVPGAEIEVTPWMPEMGHGATEKSVVTERGGGLYSVGNIIFVMTGHWELRVTVRKGEVEDHAVFDFPHVGVSGHEHAARPTSVPADLDVSASRLSDNGVFRVSYEPGKEPVSINRFLTVTLTVETPEGKPVLGADITVIGDMPEHGHGFPTNPEVTRELGNGKYLVEGVKFNMPGWWVVTFHIKAGESQDSVNFNLSLR